MSKDENLHPNFSGTIADFKQTIPHYGEVSVRIFASNDKSILYMFYEANDGRTFLSSSECIKVVEINAFGVRKKIIDMGHMDAPLLEYYKQIPEEFDPKERFENCYDSRSYCNNWNYVRELEIIKMYYEKQNRTLPDLV